LNRVWQHSYDITNNQNSSENNCFIKILAKNRHKSIKALEISVVGSFESVESWVDYIHIERNSRVTHIRQRGYYGH